MLIEFKCPRCQAILQDPIDFAGRKSKCPRCKNEVIVPNKPKMPIEKAKVIKNAGKRFE
jgi:DNA-directed RNA polymerase subunit RPC12/RpoP